MGKHNHEKLLKAKMDIVNDEGKTLLKGFCDHCGNISFQSLLHVEVVLKEYSYFFSQCTICKEVALRKQAGDWNAPVRIFDQPKLKAAGFEQLWPSSLSLPPEAPKRVREIYEEARIIKRHSPSSFVVQIGRALEAVTNDKNAEGGSLYKKLNWLIEQEYLPRLFGEMGQLNRIIRNWGAHDTEINVDFRDVEIVDEFFKAIIEYIYVAPARVERVSNLIKNRKAS